MLKINWLKQRIYGIRLLLLMGLGLLMHGLYIPAKALLAQQLLEKAWQTTQRENKVAKPWPWADTYPIAELTLPDSTYIVLQGTSGRSLAFAPGHLSGSTAPGKVGHTVISAHRDTHFWALEMLNYEDVITIKSGASELSYKVISMRVIDTRTEMLILEPDRALLTLVTCYPFDSVMSGTPLRYRVDARLIKSPDSKERHRWL